MLNSFQRTPKNHCAMTLMFSMKHWNVVRRPGMCCPWHTDFSRRSMQACVATGVRIEAAGVPESAWVHRNFTSPCSGHVLRWAGAKNRTLFTTTGA